MKEVYYSDKQISGNIIRTIKNNLLDYMPKEVL